MSVVRFACRLVGASRRSLPPPRDGNQAERHRLTPACPFLPSLPAGAFLVEQAAPGRPLTAARQRAQFRRWCLLGATPTIRSRRRMMKAAPRRAATSRRAHHFSQVPERGQHGCKPAPQRRAGRQSGAIRIMSAQADRPRHRAARNGDRWM